MKRFSRPTSQSVRLALSYLAIIMMLCGTFSVIFYHTSTSGLAIHFTDAPQSSGASPAAKNTPKDQGFAMGVETQGKTSAAASISSDDISALNEQLATQMATVRANLVTRLVLFNLGVLGVGAALSYYLARRTLRPIEAAMEAQSRFAADASHELRTPLTVMQSEIEVTLRKPTLTPKRAQAALVSIHQEVARLKDLSEGLLRLARNDLPKNAFEEVEIDDIVNVAVNRVLKAAQAKNMTIIDTIPKVRLRGDRQGLTQALMVLLDNAIKYSPPKTTVRIQGQVEGKHFRLKVTDEGPGIPAADLPHIFERFYRADPSRSATQAPGHGLGLSIAQKIITQHGGTITAISHKNRPGATFTIVLPFLGNF